MFPHLGKLTELSNGSFRVDKVGDVMANGEMVTANLHFVATRPGRSPSMDDVDLMRIEAGQIKDNEAVMYPVRGGTTATVGLFRSRL